MLKIISGAQTGVDRAVLDVALRNLIACGGWCPGGRKAEDGVIPDRYPVQETIEDSYEERTRKNVTDSDGTIIIYFGRLYGGTEKALLYCIREIKPYLLIDAREIDAQRAAERINEFIIQSSGNTYNFAGPRASEEAAAYEYTVATMEKFLTLRNDSQLQSRPE